MAIYHALPALVAQERRKKLIELIKKKFPEKAQGCILIFSGFESENIFKPNASFYYLTGLQEPAACLLIDIEKDTSHLFVPQMVQERKKWIGHSLYDEKAEQFGLNSIEFAGTECQGYTCYHYFDQQVFAHVIDRLKNIVAKKSPLYVLLPLSGSQYLDQRFFLSRLGEYIPQLSSAFIDISSLVAQLRRKKSKLEIEYIYHAVEATIKAQQAIAQEIKPGMKEYEIQAFIEYVFKATGCDIAFPSIVASGKHTTMLHYHHNNGVLQKGDLLVVDIGARYNSYCADITRTYPVLKKFSAEQKKYYDLVLQAQDYIASIAQPGYWLSNKENPEKSLQHLATDFFKKHGVAQYFWHGIGHFLGLDVHDVGDTMIPLEEDDIITIEPGLYFPEHGFGIRIEDDYWINAKGAISLSESLPKAADEIEKIMA